ncbi:MAG: sulfotransferase [Deltaproteobacteria bacterium]|nr:sulfotransferase [Deltaproteobacteria bacterium]
MLPSFLIIGAMKSATTSLFRDLGYSPAVFLPEDKEPNSLTSEAVLSGEGRRAYEALFSGATAGQLCGEASTAYTKRPEIDGVAGRAHALLGPELKLIYLVRDPVERIISHHHHDVARGVASPDIDAEVRRQPRYLDISRYAYQLEPWIETFGRDHLLILRFEDFTARRREVVDEVCRFLGLQPCGHLIDAGKTFNPGDNRRPTTALWRRLVGHPLYRRGLRRLLPWQVRERLRLRLLPKAPARPPPPRPETVDWIVDELHEDMEALGHLMGSAGAAPWERWRQARSES